MEFAGFEDGDWHARMNEWINAADVGRRRAAASEEVVEEERNEKRER